MESGAAENGLEKRARSRPSSTTKACGQLDHEAENEAQGDR